MLSTGESFKRFHKPSNDKTFCESLSQNEDILSLFDETKTNFVLTLINAIDNFFCGLCDSPIVFIDIVGSKKEASFIEYFSLLNLAYPQVNFCLRFIGPEIPNQLDNFKHEDQNLSINVIKSEYPIISSSQSVADLIVCYNPGYFMYAQWRGFVEFLNKNPTQNMIITEFDLESLERDLSLLKHDKNVKMFRNPYPSQEILAGIKTDNKKNWNI